MTAEAGSAAGKPRSGNAGVARALRFVPLAIGALSLLLGLFAGLSRIGLVLPEPAPTLAEIHGALMVSGFLGTLISLERAVAFGRPWAYGAPLISALGAMALIAGATQAAMLCFIVASAFMTAASCVLQIRHPAAPMALLCVASLCWGIGTVFWLFGAPISVAVGWWLTFLVVTVAAERLELSRILAPSLRAEAVFGLFILLIVIGAVRGEYGGAAPFTAAGLIGGAIWLLRYDLARRTIRTSGAAQFAAACIIAGHVWLIVAGLLLLAAPAGAAFTYDAAVHAIAIGFVLSMIFGHAPIILPAVTGLKLPFSPYVYLGLGLLHASLILRIGADVTEQVAWRPLSGILTLVSLLAYAAATVFGIFRARRGATRR
jgi:hypothetical protein